MSFETKYSCTDCNDVFFVITENRPKGRCPACPKCKQKHPERRSISKSNITYSQELLDKRHEEIVNSKKAPSVGGSNFTKAMDSTAEIVMQDYGLTNLQDNLRAGDSMAPKLSHELERKVDQVFKPQKPIMGAPAATSMNNSLMRQINAGAFKGYGGASDVVARQQNSGIRMPTNVLFEHQRGDKT